MYIILQMVAIYSYDKYNILAMRSNDLVIRSLPEALRYM